ncbi:MAG: chromosome segregation protein SMC [Anaerolineales bacterium]
MRLKSITLNGFKTFATKTEFEFDERVTVIVGPNGSGKSNIADAVRWVLGEQSYKLLRGRKTVDMIFHGSDERPRSGMASATIVFDNSDGWLPIDFSEVSITRRAYRDGNNEYLINGQQVLLRDVNELLGQSGLAGRTYTIIGQGLVDAALALNATERRSLFEEAAGIGLYQSRREDAERRLEKTWRNLDRVEDILSELKPRLRSLERQAKRSEKFEQVRADLKELMREWYGYHWYEVQEALKEAQKREKTQRKALGEARSKQADLDRKLTQYQTELHGLRAQLNTWHRELSGQHASREEVSRELAVTLERIRTLEKRGNELVTDLARWEEQKKASKDRLESAEEEVRELESDLERAKAHYEDAHQKLMAYEKDRDNYDQDLDRTRQELTKGKESLSSIQARIEDRQDQIQNKQDQLSNLAEKVEKQRAILKEGEGELQAAKEDWEKAKQIRQEVEKGLAVLRDELQSAARYLDQLREKIPSLEMEISRTRAELDVLKQAEDKHAGYAEGARILLQRAQEGGLSGTLGALSNHLDVDEGYETSIAAALGEYVDAVLLEKRRTAREALDILLREATRGALLPLDSLTPPEPLQVDKNTPGVVDVALNLVDVDPKLQPVMDLLLGQVIVVEDRRNIDRVLANQPVGTKVVTLQGEVFYSSGQVFAGQKRPTSTLNRSRQRKSWEEKYHQAVAEKTELEKQKNEVERRIADKREEERSLEKQLEEKLDLEERAERATHQAVIARDQKRQEFEWHTAQKEALREEIDRARTEIETLQEKEKETREKIEDIERALQEKQTHLDQRIQAAKREKVSEWRTEVAVTEKALADARDRLVEREEAWQDVVQRVDQMYQRKAEIAEEIEALNAKKGEWQRKEEDIESRIQQIRTLIERSEEELEEKEQEQSRLHQAEAEARKSLNQAERAYAQAEVALTRERDNLERMQERIREDIGLVEYEYHDDISGPTPLPLDGYVEKLPRVRDISLDLENNIKSLRRQMKRLGSINPEAQTEHREVKERHQFMVEQLSDLRKAEADIKEVIAELEVLMEREFRKTYDAVAKEFREIFIRLFDGGEGRLVLTDPDDLTRTGVEIEARLPGRRRQGLSLLSGGERSLTAAALIFSLVKVSPTPFCVLDEVDAMLDESNVARYREFLRELSSETQFIIITHNRNTVQVADVLYGVTMAEDSTSQVLSLKMDEVEEVIA